MSDKLILVVNCGSSSIKFALINPIDGKTPFVGLAENVNASNPSIHTTIQGTKKTEQLPAKASHRDCLKAIFSIIDDTGFTKQVMGIGHRVVHGGETYATPILIDDTVLKQIGTLSKLAPLHNPANLAGITAAREAFPFAPQVAIFDTAFHQTIPMHAFLYGLPYDLYKEHGVRRYGFHGSSHYFISKKAPELIGKDKSDCQIVSIHLGNGCSVSAIKNGQSVDTSMGMTPLEGLVMGTRCGDIDPGLVFHLHDQLGYDLAQINTLFNKQSGLLGLSKLSNDCRTLEAEATHGNNQAKLALDVFCYRVARYVAAVSVALSRLDAIVFTGGIGENSSLVRKKIVQHLAILNIKLNSVANEKTLGETAIISESQAPFALVIPTNEEWVIAQKTLSLLLED